MNDLRKIILIEDNLADVELVKLALHETPIELEILHFEDGNVFLEQLKSYPNYNIALILLDLNMPKISGLDVLRAMAADTRQHKIPVVVFTSSTQKTDIEACYKYGANAYIRKPIDINEFNETIKTLATFWGKINVLG
jgi:two-component system response regulator